jgi:hypothetical protein
MLGLLAMLIAVNNAATIDDMRSMGLSCVTTSPIQRPNRPTAGC